MQHNLQCKNALFLKQAGCYAMTIVPHLIILTWLPASKGCISIEETAAADQGTYSGSGSTFLLSLVNKQELDINNQNGI